MKLIIITAVADFSEAIKTLLKKTGVSAFTYKEMTGYHPTQEAELQSNWFAPDFNETDSVLFFAFVEAAKVSVLLELVADLNNQQQSTSKVHIAVVGVEQSNAY